MRHSLLWLLLICYSVNTTGQNLADRIAAFAAHPGLKGAQVGVNVIDARTGERVAAFEAGKALIPASTQKLVTTAAAMDILGPDHQFTTDLAYLGRIEGGTLMGDIYIIGGGDPSLGSPYLEGVMRLPALLARWREAIRAAGIQRIEGRVIGDGSYFGTDGTSPEWPWSDIGNYYGAGAYGLNIHENAYFLDLLQRKTVGSQPLIQGTRPEVAGLSLHNELKSGPAGSGDQAYIYAAPFTYEAIVRGSIPVGGSRFTIKGSVPDPALFAAQLLKEELVKHGISVSLPPETVRSLGPTPVAANMVRLDRLPSPPLAKLVDRTNMKSLNLYAEALFREVGKARGVAVDELAAGETTLNWLSGQGIATEGIQIIDGSGLATRNFFSPEFMTTLLHQQVQASRWRQSIPVAGRTGSMRGFLKGRAAAGKLAAKSGSLNAARSYAGYATRSDGRELAFAIMVNNYTMPGRELRQLMLELMNDLCERPLPE